MSLSYLNEKFSSAVRGMAISPASRNDRLRDVWAELRTLRSEDVDDADLRLRFDHLRGSLKRLFDGEAENDHDLAREVCDLADLFHSLYIQDIEAKARR